MPSGSTRAQWFYSALGVIAAIPVAIIFLRGDECSTASPGLRYSVFALLFLLAALGFGLATLIAMEEIVAAQIPSTCGAPGNASGAVLIVVFTLTYISIPAVTRKITRR